jgi:hypothetical protein
MADSYAPALFLEVLAFWFVLRWLLVVPLILVLGRALILLMLVGVLATLDEHRFVWAACFAGSAALAWVLLRRWRKRRSRHRLSFGVPISSIAWRRSSADEVATLCERRLGLKVEAAAPANVAAEHPAPTVLALAGDGLWVLEDESRLRHPRIGRVLASWDRAGLVPHVEHSRRGESFELSWPRHGALVRGTMPSGAPADQFTGVLLADELARI